MSSLWQKDGSLLWLPGNVGTLMYDDACCCAAAPADCNEWAASPDFTSPASTMKLECLFGWKFRGDLTYCTPCDAGGPPPAIFYVPYYSSSPIPKLTYWNTTSNPGWTCSQETGTWRLGPKAEIECAGFGPYNIGKVAEIRAGNSVSWTTFRAKPKWTNLTYGSGFGTEYTLYTDTTEAVYGDWANPTVSLCWEPDVPADTNLAVFKVTF